MSFTTKCSSHRPRLINIISKWWRKFSRRIRLPTAAHSHRSRCSRHLHKTIHSCRLKKTFNGQQNPLIGTNSHQSPHSVWSSRTTRIKKFSKSSFQKATKVTQSIFTPTVVPCMVWDCYSLERQINKSLITLPACWPTQLTARTKSLCMALVLDLVWHHLLQVMKRLARDLKTFWTAALQLWDKLQPFH